MTTDDAMPIEDRMAVQIGRGRRVLVEHERERRADAETVPMTVETIAARARERAARATPRPEPAAEAAPVEAVLRDAGVPIVLLETVLGPALRLDAPAIVALRAAQEDGRVFGVLAGSIGVGKSVAAAAWLRAAHAGVDPGFASRGLSRWIHAHELARLSGFDDDGLEQLERVRFLVLDDLGVEYLDGKGWLGAAVDSLVYQRHGNRRATVLTTNLSARDFVARYGPRVASRLHEVGAFIEVAGADLRRAPRAAS